VQPPSLAVHASLDIPTIARALFAAYPDAMLAVDTQGKIVLANTAAALLFGYDVEELLRMGVDALVPDAVRSRHASFRGAYGQRPAPRPMGTQTDLVARRKDGSEVMVEIALSPMQDGGQVYVLAAIRDINAYPRALQALRRARYSDSLARLGRLAIDARDTHVLLDSAPALAAEALDVEAARVYLLDESRSEFRVAGGKGVLPSEASGSRVANDAQSLLGYVLAQAAPVIVHDFRSEQRFKVPQAYVDAGLVSGMAVPLFERGQVMGVLAVRSFKALHFGADEQGFVQTLADMLANCLLRIRTEEALQHAARLESVGQLTGGIAHDFNNLLTVIQGNLQVLAELDLPVQDAQAQQLLAAAERAGRRAAELTGKLLAFSRRQVLRPGVVDVNALLHSLADMLRRTLDQHIAVSVEVAPDCPPVLADPSLLESALLNVAINARDAMPQGGRLQFEARPALPPMDLDADAPAAARRFVSIVVSDNGVGMSDAVKERAFEPFYTTKESGRGTGLGLSTVYGFVRQSNGAVTIDSEVGQGTRISLYLPTPQTEDAAAHVGALARSLLPQGLRLLLVEDDVEVRKVLRHFLEGMGCQVSDAVNGEQALGLLDPGAGFDLLLTDIALGPGMRGTELAALAQQRQPGLPVLLMSGFTPEFLDTGNDALANWPLLRKPFKRAELERAIVEALSY